MNVDKLMEMTEQLFMVVRAQNKYIASLEEKKAKVQTKIIVERDHLYRENSVKLFKQYTAEIDGLKEELKLKDREIECLKAGYIKNVYV